MLHGIRGQDDISHIHFFVQTSRDPGVHDHGYAEPVRKDLGTGRGIDFSDAGTHHGTFLSTEQSRIKHHPRAFLSPHILHVRLQSGYLFFHCSNDSDHCFFLRVRLS